MSNLAAIPWNTRTHQRVASRLDTLRANGKITDGHVLPPERELSALCGVSRPTLRQVMQTLEAHGRVKSHARRGRVLVGEPDGRQASDRSLSHMLVLVTDAKGHSPDGSKPAPRGYALQMVAAVTEAAIAAGFELIVLRLDSAGSSLPALVREGVAGVVMATTLQRGETEHAVAAEARRLGVPVAAYGFRLDRPEADTDASATTGDEWDVVSSDHHAGGYLITKWLIEEKGCRRPVPYLRVKSYITEAGELPTWWRQRIAGYRRAMDEAGLEPADPMHVEAVWGDQALTPAARERDARYAAGHLAPLLHANDQPDAFVAASDYCASVVEGGLDHALPPGRPRPIVTGYDNTWATLRRMGLIARPPAVTADKNLDAIGAALVRRVRARLDGGPFEPPELITPRILARGGSGDDVSPIDPVH